MDDFDEADEQNEEDLMLLGDEFANRGNLKQFIIDQFSEFIENPQFKQGREYLTYCVKHGVEQTFLFWKVPVERCGVNTEFFA